METEPPHPGRGATRAKAGRLPRRLGGVARVAPLSRGAEAGEEDVTGGVGRSGLNHRLISVNPPGYRPDTQRRRPVNLVGPEAMGLPRHGVVAGQ